MAGRIQSKCELLLDELKKARRVAVAFSGGVDSAFLLDFSHKALADDCMAITCKLAGSPQREIALAADFCNKHSIRHEVVEFDELSIPGFAQNTPERCYICKKAFFSKIVEVAKAHNFNYVADGTNVDDLSDYRPGLKAIKELDVQSPLANAKWSKAEIRQLLASAGLNEISQQSSSACFSSRIPYGSEITKEKLLNIGKAEAELSKILSFVRVRHHGDIARIETDSQQLSIVLENRNFVLDVLKRAGFKRAVLDLEPYKVGGMGECPGGGK